MFTWWKLRKDPAFRTARELVRQWGFSQPSVKKIEGIQLRANEQGRWVFAVFYRISHARPCPYFLLCVDKQSNTVTQLNLESNEASSYRLKNYK